MTRQSRMLLVLVVVAIGSVVVLMLMAQRYSKILTKRSEPTVYTAPRVADTTQGQAQPESSSGSSRAALRATPDERISAALDDIDAFISVRQALKAALAEELPVPTESLDEGVLAGLQEIRRAARIDSGLLEAEYTQIRKLYRLWQEDGERLPAPFAEAFEMRRESLTQIDLGPYESYDL